MMILPQGSLREAHQEQSYEQHKKFHGLRLFHTHGKKGWGKKYVNDVFIYSRPRDWHELCHETSPVTSKIGNNYVLSVFN